MEQYRNPEMAEPADPIKRQLEDIMTKIGYSSSDIRSINSDGEYHILGFRPQDSVWYECKISPQQIGMAPNALEKAIIDSMKPVGKNK